MINYKFILIFMITFNHAFLACAALNLSANPVTGGNSIRFGRVNGQTALNREVRLRVNSSEGQPYQIFQRLIEPLINERGESLSFDALSAYTLLGSNTSGTAYLQNPEILAIGEQLLYSSSPSGQNDTISVAYAVNSSRLTLSGNFLGKIAYTVRPIGGAFQDTVILNVMLEIPDEFKVNVEGRRARGGIQLSHDGHNPSEDFLKISFDGNFNREIRVTQEVRSPLMNERGEELDLKAVQFYTTGESMERLSITSPKHLDRRQEKLYSSNKDSDSFQVHFQMEDAVLKEQSAGVYRGRLSLAVTGQSGSREFPVDIEVEIKPVFNLEFTLPVEGMRFSSVLPSAPPEIREVIVDVQTNLGKPYIVTQKSLSPMTNERGFFIDKRFFTMKEEVEDGSQGRTAHSEFEPVPTGDAPIFFSDQRGSSARFRVQYRLSGYTGMEPGDYQTSIVYSLGER